MVQYVRSRIQKINEEFALQAVHTKKRNTKSDDMPLYDAMHVGVYLLVPLLVGIGLGIMLDNKNGIKPVGFFLGLLFGVIGSFFNLIKFVRQFSRHASNKH